jgi:hypothetical protein
MTAREFRRWLAKQGCTFESHKGGTDISPSFAAGGVPNSRCTVAIKSWVRVSSKIKKDLGLD